MECGIRTGPLTGSERMVRTKKEGVSGSMEEAKKWGKEKGKKKKEKKKKKKKKKNKKK